MRMAWTWRCYTGLPYPQVPTVSQPSAGCWEDRAWTKDLPGPAIFSQGLSERKCGNTECGVLNMTMAYVHLEG